jgi:hypothetical protein
LINRGQIIVQKKGHKKVSPTDIDQATKSKYTNGYPGKSTRINAF